MRKPLLFLAGLLAVSVPPTAVPAQVKPPAPPAGKSSLFQRKLNGSEQKLRGFVDLNTHPMAHLGFGGKVLHGAPGVGVTMPSGTIYDPKSLEATGTTCNTAPEEAASAAQALGSCFSTHGGSDFKKNKCGSDIRRAALDHFEDGLHTNKPHDVDSPPGYPYFTRWPKHDDVLHQQMWIDWIKRAYDGGMRVMVGLAINSYTFATGVEADRPTNDKASADLQLTELKSLVERNQAWMGVAYSPADVRRIVGTEDKLAVILGVELDDIGDFSRLRVEPSAAAVRAEIRRLHKSGARYIFPVHTIDNVFGGAAVSEDQYNRANCFHFGAWWQLGCAGKGDGITHQVDPSTDPFKALKLTRCSGAAHVPACGAVGHVNRRGLQPMGKEALDEMMRLGMLIDVDHASRRTVADIFAHTRSVDYPLMSGHSGLRAASVEKPDESQRTAAEYQEIARRGGMAGVSWANSDTEQWLKNLGAVKATAKLGLGLGSGINGLVKMPAPRAACKNGGCVRYSATFPQAAFGNKRWNYNTEGVAHVGLFPDALRDVESQGGQAMVNELFDGAEAFAPTWEKAVAAGKRVRPAPAGTGDLGMPCEANKQCRSGLCEPRVGCVPRPLQGKGGDFCTDNKQCKGSHCTISNGWNSGRCSSTERDIGQRCASHTECGSGLCDPRPGAGCVPNRNGNGGDFCTDHSQCRSGHCAIAAGKIAGTCTPAARELGQACSKHGECRSGLCDPRSGAGCVPNRNGNVGDMCTQSTQCRSGRCGVPTGRIVGTCGSTTRELGQKCTSHAECRSALCDSRPGAGCVPNRTGSEGDFCTDRAQCRSARCTIPAGKLAGKCGK
jgi:microsomal dipeptidase-like Zn-dependent dipeptidase